MIHTFHDEENVQSTIEKNDSKGAIKSKEIIPVTFIPHHHHTNSYISAPPASCHSNSTLSTSQSSSHSTQSSSSSSERMAAVAIAPTRNTFHRQTRSIVDIILSVEKSSNCNQWNQNYSPQQQGISSIIGPIESQYSGLSFPIDHHRSQQQKVSGSRSSSTNSSSSINTAIQQQQELIPLPPPPKPNASKQEHHRYFYALRKATRSRKQQQQQQQASSVMMNTKRSQPSLEETIFALENMRKNGDNQQTSYPRSSSPNYTYQKEDTSHSAMMAWHKSSIEFHNHHHQRSSSSSSLKLDQDFLMELLVAESQEVDLLFGELNEVRKLQQAELGF